MARRKDTQLTHGGRNPRQQHGIVNPPVYHASTVLFPTLDALEQSHVRPFEGVSYGRYGTPTHFAFEQALRELDGAHGAVTTSSGLAAIHIALTAFLGQGDHVLVTDSAYGPTRKLCDGLLKKQGVQTTYYDPRMGAGIDGLMRPNTRVVYVESPGSLTFELQDISAIAQAAHRHGAVVLMDNTWATPLFFPALAQGVDVCVHAATKYIVGHADAMLGVISCTEACYDAVKRTAVAVGNCAGPDDVYLGLRGLRTLGARLRQHQQTALALCAWLRRQPEVETLLYPALPEDPDHALWRRDFSGASGLFGVVLKPCSRAALAAMVEGLQLFGMGYSWGGDESLLLPVPAESIRAQRSATAWPHAGPLLRLHAGLEDPQDLIEDLEAGFSRLRKAVA
jgi:cysteine-S-conjugate beta-lyase